MGYFPATTYHSIISLCLSFPVGRWFCSCCFVVQFGRAQTHFLEVERPQHLWVPGCQRLLSVPSAQLTEWIFFHDNALSLSLDPQFACL